MAQDSFQLNEKAAKQYEKNSVAAVFGPLAEITLDHIPLFDDDVILDAACGTGIVARKAREKIGPKPRIIGVDLNKGMIETAQSLSDPYSRSCEWHTADITKIPFDDATFSVAICQQGLQFFPDKKAALLELQRVLKPEGRLVFTVWDSANVLFKSLAVSLGKHIGHGAVQQILAPFSYNDGAAISDLVSDAGYCDVSVKTLSVDRTLAASKSTIHNQIMANPAGAAVAEKGDEVMALIVDEVFSSLSDCRHGANFIIPQSTHLVQAKTL